MLVAIVALLLGSQVQPSHYEPRAWAPPRSAVKFDFSPAKNLEPPADFCTAAQAAGFLVGNYVCMRGDGGHTAAMVDGGTAMALSLAEGTPTNQSLSFTPCAQTSCPVGGQLVANEPYWKTSSTTVPDAPDSGATLCLYMSAPDNAAERLHGKWNDGNGPTAAFAVDVLTNGVPRWYSGNGSTTANVSGTAVTVGALQLVCATYQRVGGSDDNIIRTYLDGVTGASDSSQKLMQANSIPISFGGAGNGSFNHTGRIAGAVWTDTTIAASGVQALAHSLNVRASTLLRGTKGEAVTFARNSAATCVASDGTLSVLPVDRPCVTSSGLLSESAATNYALQSRDFSNAAWAKTNLSCARDATGGDGDPLGASTCTASDVNGTAIQDITIAEEARTFSVWILRKTGTGGLDITRNNGGSWTALDSSVCWDPGSRAATAPNSSTWVRCAVSSTLENPQVGIRLQTSGDAVYVDFSQDESGPVATSEIVVGAIAAARAATTASVANPLNGVDPMSWCIGGTVTPTGGAWSAGALIAYGTAGADDTASLTVDASGVMTLTVIDAASGTKSVSIDSGASVASHSVYGCSALGVLGLWVDSAQPAQTGAGAGTGVVTTQPATTYLGTTGSIAQPNAFLDDIKVLKRGQP